MFEFLQQLPPEVRALAEREWLSVADASKVFGVSERTIDFWRKEGMPAEKRAGDAARPNKKSWHYKLEPCIAWAHQAGKKFTPPAADLLTAAEGAAEEAKARKAATDAQAQSEADAALAKIEAEIARISIEFADPIKRADFLRRELAKLQQMNVGLSNQVLAQKYAGTLNTLSGELRRTEEHAIKMDEAGERTMARQDAVAMMVDLVDTFNGQLDGMSASATDKAVDLILDRGTLPSREGLQSIIAAAIGLSAVAVREVLTKELVAKSESIRRAAERAAPAVPPGDAPGVAA